MRYIKENISVIAVVILMSLCLVTIAISVRVTKTLFEKNQQIVRNRSNMAEDINADDNYKTIDAGKLSDFILNYNGKRVSSIKAFINNDKDILVSFDDLLDELDIEFSYFSSDDILVTQISNEQLTIKLGEPSFKYGDNEYELSFAPVTAKDHILVPLDLFDHLTGFGTNVSYLMGISFLYYYPDNDIATNSEPFFFTIDNAGSAQITDLYGKQIAAVSEDMLPEKRGYSLHMSKSGNTLVLNMNDKIYLVGDGNKLYSVNAGINATLSDDEKYLYWIDKNDEIAYIYDIETKKNKALGDFYTKIENGNNVVFNSSVFNIVYDFEESSNSTKIVLTDEKHSEYYAYVQRNGTTLVAAEVKVSQDKACLLFETDKGYNVLEQGSLSVINLGNADAADWISNKLILLREDEILSVIDKNGNNGRSPDEIYKLLGKSSNLTNEIFYARDSKIFYEEQGETVEIPYLNIDYDYITGGSSQGPFIAVSTLNNSVFFLKENDRLRIGSTTKLLIDMHETNVITKYERCINLSPDGMYYSLLMNENDMLNLLIIDNSTLITTKLILDISVSDLSKFNNIKIKWLSNTKMVVSSNSNAFLIDITDIVKINKIILPMNSELKSVLTVR